MTSPGDIRVLFLGCGDLGTGAAHRLFDVGFRVAVLELPVPLAVRRRVAFAEAARRGEVEVEGVVCRRVELAGLRHAWPSDAVPLVVGDVEPALGALGPHAVVDARMQKRPSALPPHPGRFVVALGPGHTAGVDCDAVVETERGPDLGRVLWTGSAAADTGVPAELGGASAARVLRAPAAGVLRARVGIGDRVRAGDVVGDVGGMPVVSAIGGLVRGFLADGDRVHAEQKLGDVDPRPSAPSPDRISDKARAVGDGVLRAIRRAFDLPDEGSA